MTRVLARRSAGAGRAFTWMQEAAAATPPAFLGEPRAWLGWFPWDARQAVDRKSPAREAGGVGEVIDDAVAPRAHAVVFVVLENVRKRFAYGARPAELARVIAIRPDLPCSAQHRIEPLRQRDDEAADAG